MRGKIKQRYKLHADAIQDFDYSISQRPNNVTALYYRSLSYHQLGRLHNALDDLNQVLNYDPSLVPALFIRADVLKGLKQIEDGKLLPKDSEEFWFCPYCGKAMAWVSGKICSSCNLDGGLSAR